MTILALSNDVEKRLSQLDLSAKGMDAKELIALVQDLKKGLDHQAAGPAAGPSGDQVRKFYHEIIGLADYIANARAEISELRPDDITGEHLPMVADELDAIVGATEQATNTIFEAVEAIESLSGEMPEKVSEEVVDCVTRVYEACGFQDITGQRISKVVAALKEVEQTVEALQSTFGEWFAAEDEVGQSRAKVRADGKPQRPDEHLMNGPQRIEDAISQDDIDALLNNG